MVSKAAGLLWLLMSASRTMASFGVSWPHKRVPLKDRVTAPQPRSNLESRTSEQRRCLTTKTERKAFYLISAPPPPIKSISLTSLTHPHPAFAVNGQDFPGVHFDIGESYAGRLPIIGTDAPNELFFWYFPSANPAASNEITIWLAGGPGCSSLDGLIQENGPFLWQPGTAYPLPNPFSWTHLTNMVWIDQPLGTGLSLAAEGEAEMILNETDVAVDFAGFWKNFVETFDLQGADVYLTGESYAGMYIPYIADYFLDLNDTTYYNVKGIQLNDPTIGLDSVLQEAPAGAFLNEWNNVLALNDTYVADVNMLADACGYTAWMEQALTFPPIGKFVDPTLLINTTLIPDPNLCAVYEAIVLGAVYVNPCFNMYHVTDYCPFVSNILGWPSQGWGPKDFFNRSDVQQALHITPYTDYAVCGNAALGLNAGDSPPSSFTALPNVIEKTNNVIVANGLLDFVILSNGTLATLNNMTWNGAQGFQSSPFANEFYVPYNPTIGLALEGLEEMIFGGENVPTASVGYVGGGGYFVGVSLQSYVALVILTDRLIGNNAH